MRNGKEFLVILVTDICLLMKMYLNSNEVISLVLSTNAFNRSTLALEKVPILSISEKYIFNVFEEGIFLC